MPDEEWNAAPEDARSSSEAVHEWILRYFGYRFPHIFYLPGKDENHVGRRVEFRISETEGNFFFFQE